MKRPLIPLNPSDRTDGRGVRVKLIGFSLTLAVMGVRCAESAGKADAVDTGANPCVYSM